MQWINVRFPKFGNYSVVCKRLSAVLKCLGVKRHGVSNTRKWLRKKIRCVYLFMCIIYTVHTCTCVCLCLCIYKKPLQNFATLYHFHPWSSHHSSCLGCGYRCPPDHPAFTLPRPIQANQITAARNILLKLK